MLKLTRKNEVKFFKVNAAANRAPESADELALPDGVGKMRASNRVAHL